MHLLGKGNQIYICQNTLGAYTWKLKAPEARLLGESGETAGRHYAGPTWEANDGSRVTGSVVATVPSPDKSAIPWLLLTATATGSSGLLSAVQSIQRLETKGGIAPAAGCTAAAANQEVQVSYQAQYYFYGPPRREVLH